MTNVCAGSNIRMAFHSCQYRIRVLISVWPGMIMYGYLNTIGARQAVCHIPQRLFRFCCNVTEVKFFGQPKSVYPFLFGSRRDNAHGYHLDVVRFEEVFELVSSGLRHLNAKTVFGACAECLPPKGFHVFYSS